MQERTIYRAGAGRPGLGEVKKNTGTPIEGSGSGRPELEQLRPSLPPWNGGRGLETPVPLRMGPGRFLAGLSEVLEHLAWAIDAEYLLEDCDQVGRVELAERLRDAALAARNVVFPVEG